MLFIAPIPKPKFKFMSEFIILSNLWHKLHSICAVVRPSLQWKDIASCKLGVVAYSNFNNNNRFLENDKKFNNLKIDNHLTSLWETYINRNKTAMLLSISYERYSTNKINMVSLVASILKQSTKATD